MTELYKKYRPDKLDDVVGQPEAVRAIRKMVATKKVPHAVVFSGPSGCGKTTLARIVAAELGCVGDDYTEINAADDRGVAVARWVRKAVGASGMRGDIRCITLDEAQQLTKDAQNIILKPLEDPPDHSYLFICTTDPTKLIKPVMTRCTEIKVKALADKDMEDLVRRVIKAEGLRPKAFTKAVVDRIVEVAEGSARKALVILDQVQGLKKETLVLDGIQKSDSRRQAIDLARALIRGAKWPEVQTMLKEVEDDPEGVRLLMMNYAASVLTGAKGPVLQRAYDMMNFFRDPFDRNARAGLVLACFETVHRP